MILTLKDLRNLYKPGFIIYCLNCGGESEIHVSIYNTIVGSTLSVSCLKCGCENNEFKIGHCKNKKNILMRRMMAN